MGKRRPMSEATKKKISEAVGLAWDREDSGYHKEGFRSLEVRERISGTLKGTYGGEATIGHEDSGYFILCNQFEHPLAVGGSVVKHRYVLWTKLGCESLDCEHECHWGCGKLLVWRDGRFGIQADHLDGDKSNNDPENLVVSCVSCNVSRFWAGNPINWTPKANP